jgi:hypothetical protein
MFSDKFRLGFHGVKINLNVLWTVTPCSVVVGYQIS